MFEDRDEIVRHQMNEISNLINNALRNLGEAQFGPSYEKPVEDIPINRRT